MTTMKVIIQDYLWNDGYEAVDGESWIELNASEVADLIESLTQLKMMAGSRGLCKPLDQLLWACRNYEAEADRNAARDTAPSDAELRPSEYDDMS